MQGLAPASNRAGTIASALVPQSQRRLDGLDQVVIRLDAAVMTVLGIRNHPGRTTGVELSHKAISNVTEAVTEEVKARQAHSL